jgi:hypothetical protein
VLFGAKEEWTKDYEYVGSFLRRKVGQLQGYEVFPKKFRGFVVRNLSIMNQFGRVRWEGKTDVRNIDFEGGGLTIGECSVECRIP